MYISHLRSHRRELIRSARPPLGLSPLFILRVCLLSLSLNPPSSNI